MRLLCLTALCISGYLAWSAFQMKGVYGCSGGQLFDCDHVLKSKFSKIFGVPVSVPAVVLYATLLSILVFFRKSGPTSLLKAGWVVLTVGSLSAAGAAVWFAGLQVAEGKYCQYCLGAHACGLVLAVIVLASTPLSWKSKRQAAALAICGVLALAGTQWQSEEPNQVLVQDFPMVTDGELASGDFVAPTEAAEEFGAPVFAAPSVFAPPTGMQPVTQNEAQQVSLVPPPVDVTADSPTSAEDTSVAMTESSAGLQQTFLETPVDSTDLKSLVDKSDSISQVEFTPPMEVPVVFPDGGSGIQRVDYRKEAEANEAKSDASKADKKRTDGVPATGLNNSFKTSDDLSIKTATFQSRRQSGFTDGRLNKSAQKIAYLFFAASGATNADIGSKLMLACKPDDENKADAKATASKAAEQKPEPSKEKMVYVMGKRFSLNPKHWPIIGSPDADLIFVEMFDYTCPHCRTTNKAIEGAFKKYGERLAVLTLPVPLERTCNPTVNGSGKPGACEMAKLAIAVWRVDCTKFRDYHQYMCNQQRTVSDARRKAQELVGKDKLKAEMALPHAADYIKKHVQLYQKVGEGSVPKLMFPTRTLTGELKQSTILVSTIREQLDH